MSLPTLFASTGTEKNLWNLSPGHTMTSSLKEIDRDVQVQLVKAKVRLFLPRKCELAFSSISSSLDQHSVTLVVNGSCDLLQSYWLVCFVNDLRASLLAM